MRVVRGTVGAPKGLISRRFGEERTRKEGSFLVQGASDISYFGDSLVRYITKSSRSVVYYFNSEDRCYFNIRLNHLKSLYRHNSKDNIHINEKIRKTLKVVKASALKNQTLYFKNISPFELGKSFFKRLFYVDVPRLLKIHEVVSKLVNRLDFRALLITNNTLPETSVFL